MDLTASFKNIGALFCCDDWVSIKIGGSLLKFSEVFDGLQRPLRTEKALDVYSTKGRGVETMTELLGTNISHQMGGCIRVPVGVTVKANHAPARALRTPVFSLVELLLREGRQQKPQTLNLLGV
jgi:hypothetical protein